MTDFFKAIRKAQPFGHNDIRPCPLIDKLVSPLREDAREVARIYRRVWLKEYQWVSAGREIIAKTQISWYNIPS